MGLTKGEFVSEPGQCEGKVYLVESGQIRLFQLSEDGREQTLDILPKGAIYGDLLLDSTVDLDCVFVAAENDDTCVCILDKKEFFEILVTKPQLALKIISDLSQRLSSAQQKITHFSLANAKARLLSELIRLGKDFGNESAGKIKLKRKFTHEQLASLIGTTRETVTKTLRSINDDCEDCVIQDKDRHFILDKDKVMDVISGL